jgi:triosephosphate isomerase
MYIVGNWKMHKTAKEAALYIEAILPQIKGAAAQVYLAVPFTAIAATQNSSIKIGAQNMSDALQGAFTGEISALMLKEAGASFCLIGHSERRHLFGEGDELILRKVKTALTQGILPILCIGEKEGEEMEEVLEKQLKGLSGTDGLMVAYEPVWAIGTGKSAEIDHIQKAHRFCRKFLGKKVPILYGGSVSLENVAEIGAMEDVDGVLVGGASLNPDSFAKMIHQLRKRK